MSTINTLLVPEREAFPPLVPKAFRMPFSLPSGEVSPRNKLLIFFSCWWLYEVFLLRFPPQLFLPELSFSVCFLFYTSW